MVTYHAAKGDEIALPECITTLITHITFPGTPGRCRTQYPVFSHLVYVLCPGGSQSEHTCCPYGARRVDVQEAWSMDLPGEHASHTVGLLYHQDAKHFVDALID